MLFILDRSLDEIANNNEHQLHEELWIQFNIIALSRRNRKIALFIESSELFPIIAVSNRVGNQVKSIFLSVNNSRAFKKSLLEKLSTRIRIVASGDIIHEKKYGNVVEIIIPLAKIPFGIFSAPALLAENLHDAQAYSVMSRIVREAGVGDLPAVDINFELKGGGGSTVNVEYKNLKNLQDRLLLCILDSDIKFPGDVTNNVNLDIIDNNFKFPSPISTACVIETYSIENLLPFDSLYELSPFSDDEGAKYRLKVDRPFLNKHGSDTYWRYIRLKKGVDCKTFRDANSVGIFWQSFSGRFTDYSSKNCKKNISDCKHSCLKSPTYPDSVVKNFSSHYFASSNRNFSGLYLSVPDSVKDSFVKIATLVTAWGCVGRELPGIASD